ncbi:MAG: hypothetical protein Q9225_007799 [Loekoesia sp. 1 TL-2023]
MATSNALLLQGDLQCTELQWTAVVRTLEQWRASGLAYRYFNWEPTIYPHAHACVKEMFPDDEVEELKRKTTDFTVEVMEMLNGRRVVSLPDSNFDPATFQAPETTCSPLTAEGDRIWRTVAQGFQDGAILIPPLANEVAVASPPSHQDLILTSVNNLIGSLTATIDQIIPYVICIQDLSLRPGAPSPEDTPSAPASANLSTYVNAYISQATRIRPPTSSLLHSLCVQNVHIHSLQLLLIPVEKEESTSKLSNLLEKLVQETESCLQHIQYIDAGVTNVTPTSSEFLLQPAHPSNNHFSSPTVLTNQKLQILSAIEANRDSTKGSLKSWARDRKRRDQFLLREDEGQRLLNAVGPLGEGILVGND